MFSPGIMRLQSSRTLARKNSACHQGWIGLSGIKAPQSACNNLRSEFMGGVTTVGLMGSEFYLRVIVNLRVLMYLEMIVGRAGLIFKRTVFRMQRNEARRCAKKRLPFPGKDSTIFTQICQ
jgi:hypothetical protein